MTTHQSTRLLDQWQSKHPKLIDFGLDRVLHLLERLGNPHHRLPPTIHVAGTNGKGSTIAFLRSILEAAGQRVHVYTSPHLVSFHERIRLAGSLIDETELHDLLVTCDKIYGDFQATYFELTTAAAFKIFSDVPADFLLLETGLGGRLDATNVIEDPALSLITPISMDHMDFLGNTIESIAREKAAIQKPAQPSLSGPQLPPVLQELKAYARQVGADLLTAPDDWSYDLPQTDNRAGDFILNEGGRCWQLPAPVLGGQHQYGNAALAAMAACRLGQMGLVPMTDQALVAGLRNAKWPGRLMDLPPDLPLVNNLSSILPACQVTVDGGHNQAAGANLEKELRRWRQHHPAGPIFLVVGMLTSKAAGDFLDSFVGVADGILVLSIPDQPNSFKAEDLGLLARKAGHDNVKAIENFADIPAGIASLNKSLKPLSKPETGRVLITGSLYLAGSLLRDQGIRLT